MPLPYRRVTWTTAKPLMATAVTFWIVLVKLSSSVMAVAAVGSLAACGGGGDLSSLASAPAPALPPAVVTPAVFAFGVASGDRLTDRVIRWSHAKVPNGTADVALTWQVASDAAFATLVKTGALTTTESSSFTAKVEVTGLVAGATYFYRCRDATGASSIVGPRARCQPVASRRSSPTRNTLCSWATTSMSTARTRSSMATAASRVTASPACPTTSSR